MRLKSPQTPPSGIEVHSVLVEEASDVARELYSLGHARPRAARLTWSWRRLPAVWTSRRSPRAPPTRSSGSGPIRALGIQDFQARRLAYGLGLTGDQFKQAAALIRSLFSLYLALDASLAEINPLVVTKDGRVLALDAKLNFDDNALWRHPAILALRDVNEEDPLDVEASKYNLNYIKLGRQRGLHGQRRRPGDGHDGHREAGRRRAGELPRRGRRASPEQIENAFRILRRTPT
jgi:succinyl-CoA synthetase beta subunit